MSEIGKEIGKWLVAVGALLVGVGSLLWLTGGLRFWQKLGRLPGDLVWEREGVSVYVPLTTCLVVSVVLTVVSWLCRR